jgi:SWI/SNF-related matrix-associated actin-dependent regulator of chromatin subfamily A-like protein 1
MSSYNCKDYHLRLVVDDLSCRRYIRAVGPGEVLLKLQQVDGVRFGWIGDDCTAYVEATITNALTLEAIATPTSVSDDYREWRQSHVQGDRRSELDHSIEALSSLRAPLAHQRSFLAMASIRHSLINASEQGTGKTLAAWLTLAMWRSRRSIIICPKSLASEWESEWSKTWDDGTCPIRCVRVDCGSINSRRALIELVTKPEIDRVDHCGTALVVNYEVVSALAPQLIDYRPEALVCDEAYRLKSPQAGVTKAVMKLKSACKPRVLLLTGTPVGNHVGDLWSQLKLVGGDVPGSYHQFLQRYATLVPLQLGPRTVQKPVGIRDLPGIIGVMKPVWFRVTKATCLQLPPKEYRRVTLEAPKVQRDLYQYVTKRGQAALGDALSLESRAVVMMRLHQIAGGHEPKLSYAGGSQYLELKCPKISWLENFARDVLVNDATCRVIVWATYRHELRRIAASLRRVLGDVVQVCDGSADTEDLERWKLSFNSRQEGGVQVLACQHKKMAYGHNLQACDWNVYFSNSWSYVDRVQSEDRSHRQGRADGVRYVDLLLRGTIDEDVLRALDKKQDFSAALTPSTVGGVAACDPLTYHKFRGVIP